MKKQVEIRENQLQVIVKESGLEPTKAKYILEKFQNYFEIASEWEIKARTIKVTNETQTTDMEMARVGRLFLREKRIVVENVRKELKEQSLREGKAIDGIANVLKALIVPIEEYLEHQEKFVEIQEEKKREALRLEIEKRLEEEQIAKEKAYAEELEKKRIENERLKKEAEVREKKMAEERKKQEEILVKERAKAEADRKQQEKLLAEQKAKAEAERKIAEEKVRKEREEQEKKLAIERVKIEAEKKKTIEKARKEQEEAQAKIETERKEKLRLAEILKNQIECPKCHYKFSLKKEK